MFCSFNKIAINLLLLALSLISCTSHSKKEPEWEILIDQELTEWDNYLSYRFQPGYKGEQPLDSAGNPMKPIGMNVDTLGVFSTITENDETLIRISGEYYGCLISKKSYKNYHLRLQFKWGNKKWPPRENLGFDSGILYHSIGEPGVEYWRSWMLSQEFQIIQGGVGDYWCQASSAIDVKAHVPEGRPKPIANHSKPFIPFSRQSEYGFYCARSVNAELPVGQWNTLDLICFEDKAFHIVNDTLVMVLQNSRYYLDNEAVELHEGKIQLQSEAAEVFYKNIRIRNIAAIPDKWLKLSQ